MDTGALLVKIELSGKADADLVEIWVYNAERYSIEHADKYKSFLLQELALLTQYPGWGKAVAGFPQISCWVMKRRASGHGHAAYYEAHPDVIYVVRILHTSMYAPDYL